MDLLTATGESVELHPALVKFATEGLSSVTALSGYLGPSAREGYVTLFQSLRNLGSSVEVLASDILHIENIPETMAPYGAKTVWVADYAEVSRRAIGTSRADTPITPPAVTETQVGRLRMRQAPDAVVRPAECSKNCVSFPCISPCSRCDPCTSNCAGPVCKKEEA